MATTDKVFNIWTYDTNGTAKTTNHIVVNKDIDLTTTLGEIRKILIENKRLDSAKAQLFFCTKDGARVADDTQWSIYQNLVTGKASGSSEGVTAFDVYFELPGDKNTTSRELSENVKKVLETSLDMDLTKNKPELITAAIKGLNSSYKHADYKAVVSGNVVTAGSMSEEDWETVLRNTHYLNGHRLVFTNNANDIRTFKRIDRAPFTAFTTKSRDLSEIATVNPNITIPAKTAYYQAPQFIVTDDSYVNMFETESALSSSIASSSFSQEDIEASTGGSLFGASASIKGGFSNTESTAIANSQQKKIRTMNITYNFPRVVLHLDERSLQLTTRCKNALEMVNDEKSLIRFHQDFGHFFATNVELGGKLFAAERFTSEDESHASEKANAMKRSASASFSYGIFQASGSYSKETQEAGKTTRGSSNMEKSLSWEAVGGDTILCNNPPAWCPTVKPFRNWRVINQRDVMSIGDFIGTFKDYEWVPERFKSIKEKSKVATPCYFSLRADQDEGRNIGRSEYFGLRKDTSKKRLEPLFNHFKDNVKQTVDLGIGIGILPLDPQLKANRDETERRFGSSQYTVGWQEYVGIDGKDKRQNVGGCNFRIDVLTELHQEPQLQFNVPYTIYNEAHKSYLVGDIALPRGFEGEFALLYYTGSDSRASKFIFRRVGDSDKTGQIDKGDHVELHLCDDEGKRIGQVKRYKDDYSTLAVDLYTGRNEKLVVNNATMEYGKTT